MEFKQALPRDQATTSRRVYQVHPSWAVDGGLKGVALCCRSQGRGRRVGGLHSERCGISLPSHVLKASSKAMAIE